VGFSNNERRPCTVSELARSSDRTTGNILHHIRAERIRAARLSNGAYLIDPESADHFREFLNSQRRRRGRRPTRELEVA
jgi:hypothetical protein